MHVNATHTFPQKGGCTKKGVTGRWFILRLRLVHKLRIEKQLGLALDWLDCMSTAEILSRGWARSTQTRRTRSERSMRLRASRSSSSGEMSFFVESQDPAKGADRYQRQAGKLPIFPGPTSGRVSEELVGGWRRQEFFHAHFETVRNLEDFKQAGWAPHAP